DYVMEIALKLYPSYKDTIYLTMGVGIKDSLPALARCSLVLVLCIFCYREAIKDNKTNTLYFNMTMLSFVLYTGGSFIPMVSRFGYYLITPQILLIPGIYMSIEDEKKRKYVLFAILTASALYFLYFLYTASKPGIAVLPYRSWLFTDLEWNNIEDVLTYTNR
ncbi:MAG: EpsG family protein, partial [Lachnospiraceae bacterium]|nr:EpsG family protein [Lachnospiraceae bacterium]